MHREHTQDSKPDRHASHDCKAQLNALDLAARVLDKFKGHGGQTQAGGQSTKARKHAHDRTDTSALVLPAGDITEGASHHAGGSGRADREEQAAKEHLWVDVFGVWVEDQGGAEADESGTVDGAAADAVGEDAPDQSRGQGNEFVIEREVACEVALGLTDAEDDAEDEGLDDGEVGDETDGAKASDEVGAEVEVGDVVIDDEDPEEVFSGGLGEVDGSREGGGLGVKRKREVLVWF